MAAEGETVAVVEPQVVSEEKDNDRRIHVGNLSWNTDEDHLAEEFSKFGEVEDVKIIRERGRSKGYGFILFKNAGDAAEAIKKLNKAEVHGRQIAVDFARPKNHQPEPKANVHVAKLTESVDDDKLRAFFEQIGEVEDARVVTRQGVSSGYGFVRFKTIDEASRAIEELNGKEFDGKEIDVAFARRSGERAPRRRLVDEYAHDDGGQHHGDDGGQHLDDGDEAHDRQPRRGGGRRQQGGGRRRGGGGGGRRRSRSPPLVDNMIGDEEPVAPVNDDENRKLYVGGLSELTNEDCLRLNFSAYGKLTACDIVRDSRTNRSRSYAFISFETHEQAVEAIERLNGVPIDDSELLVEFSRSGGKRVGGRRIGGGRRGGGYRRGGGGGGGGQGRSGPYRRGAGNYRRGGSRRRNDDYDQDASPQHQQNDEFHPHDDGHQQQQPPQQQQQQQQPNNGANTTQQQ